MYKSLRAQTLHYYARPHQGIPSAPIGGAAAWRGEDLRTRTDWSLELAKDEVAEIEAAVERFAETGRALGSLRKHDFALPRLTQRIDQWKRDIRHGRGFVLIRGVPVSHWDDRRAEIFFYGLGQHLGIPGAQNPQGDLLGHVRDQRTGGDVRFYRTNKQLAVHCDSADAVGLLCMKKARSGGLSRIASSVAVFDELYRRHPELVPELFRPIWFDTKGEGGMRAFAVPPCRYADGELRTFWQSDYYYSVPDLPHLPKRSDAQRALIEVYDEIANSPELRLDMDLEPGDVQIISNHTIVHGRTAFEDFAEPEQRRHLLRLWLSMPEPRSLEQHLRTARSLLGLVGTAALEMLRERQGGRAVPAVG